MSDGIPITDWPAAATPSTVSAELHSCRPEVLCVQVNIRSRTVSTGRLSFEQTPHSKSHMPYSKIQRSVEVCVLGVLHKPVYSRLYTTVMRVKHSLLRTYLGKALRHAHSLARIASKTTLQNGQPCSAHHIYQLINEHRVCSVYTH